MSSSLSKECNFTELKNLIKICSNQDNFADAADTIDNYINSLEKDDFITIVKQIGTIPEEIEHDSSEEKLFSKASDCVLSRCFRELGLNSKVLTERADSADVIGNSIHKYSLVADAKSFRMSRTAKNQKDFKVTNLSNWRGSENDYAVLCSPYYQYPKVKSQIYSQALDLNVCLISWEHLVFMLQNNICENTNLTLESIWNSSKMLSRSSDLIYANRQCNFLDFVDKKVCDKSGLSIEEFNKELLEFKQDLILRGSEEINYWEGERLKINNYTRDEAIDELIKSKKLNQKITHINDFIRKLRG